MTYDVIIIGAGISGLAAACTLENAGLNYRVIEASERPGGRMKTDRLDSFLLDRGFHVFVTAYPELERFLDCDALALSYFYKGSLVWNGKSLSKVADPVAHPLDVVSTINNGIGTLKDKLMVAKLREELLAQESIDSQAPDLTTHAYLESYGFSNEIIEQFFRPFFGGIFLEDALETPSRIFRFLFQMFAKGKTALPAAGIEAIPVQMARKVPDNNFQFNSRVQTLTFPTVTLESGEQLSARCFILATDAQDAFSLLPNPLTQPFNGTTCLYFSSAEPPVSEPILVLNGTQNHIINNLCVPSLVAPSYAPSGKHLISVSTLSVNEELDTLKAQVLSELRTMFGSVVDTWTFLKHDAIPHALPRFEQSTPSFNKDALQVAEGVYRCGDYLETPSVNGALASGRLAAEAVLAQLKVLTPH
jgi:phytoene dehydrogenase-like protein